MSAATPVGAGGTRNDDAVTTWTLTTSTAVDHHTVIGVADSLDDARRLLDRAIRAVITRAAEATRVGLPRYTMHIDGRPGPVVQTGTDEHGHVGLLDLLDRMARPSPCPFDDDGQPLR